MWAQAVNILLGLWLMAAPSVLTSYGEAASHNDRIIGPVIVTFAVTALWECTRVVRTYNIPLGAWLVIAPWVLGYDSTSAVVSDMVTGVLVMGFSLVKGKIEQRYGGGWSAIWKSNALHQREAREQ